MAKFNLLEDNYVAWFCPGCEGGHGVPTTGHRSGKGWGWNGSLDSPTLTPSILVYAHESSPPFKPQPRCHTFITDGMINFLADCTHTLAGQTIPVPDWDD